MEITFEQLQELIQKPLDKLKQELKQEMRQEMREEMKEFRQEVREDLLTTKQELIKWMVGLVFGGVILVLSATAVYTGAVMLSTQSSPQAASSSAEPDPAKAARPGS